MKKVFVYGCFDMFHYGHLKFLKRARKYGPLYVGVLPDEYIKKTKGAGRPIINEAERFDIVNNIRFVRKTFLLEKTTSITLNLKGIEKDATEYFIDILLTDVIKTICLPDNIEISDEFRKLMKNMKIKIVIIQNDCDVSTSKIIDKIKKQV